MNGSTHAPPRFPCWCRATYSWGGETKKDLGFIEGDLIEALNAGDGSWWVGRLRRDPRAIGCFPSNFVKVLDESFQPAPNSRNASPRNTPPRQVSTTKQKSVFRKPFQAYEVAGRTSLDNERGGTPDSDKEKPKKEKSKFRPYASMKTVQAPNGTASRSVGSSPLKPTESVLRVPSPPPRGGRRSDLAAGSRTFQDARPQTFEPLQQTYNQTAVNGEYPEQQYQRSVQRSHSRAQSPAYDRPRSPLPNTFHDGSAYPQILNRTPSPNPIQQQQSQTQYQYDDVDNVDQSPSPPPPPPPAHRDLYHQNRASSYQHEEAQHHTPLPASPGGSHMTPSPLRDAINDVMSSLHDMTVYNPEQSIPTAQNAWSPDAFELVRSHSRNEHATNMNSEYQYGTQHMNEQLTRNNSSLSQAPVVPLKGSQYMTARSNSRPHTSSSESSQESSLANARRLQHRKSAFELRGGLERSYTTKTNITNSTMSSSATQSSASTQLTSRSIMSGQSAGGFSATSAGSLARRKFGLGSQKRSQRPISLFDTKSTGDLKAASESSGSGPSYHESHSSEQMHEPVRWNDNTPESAGVFGGLGTPRAKRSGFFRKMIESAKTTAKTGAATARATVSGSSRPGSRAGSVSPTKSLSGFGGGIVSAPGSSVAAVNSGSEWMQVRRDVNRSNSLSHKEQDERVERCQMLDLMPFRPVDALHEQAEGDASLDGFAVTDPTDFNTPNLALVDKSTRFVAATPTTISAGALAQNYICRPHRSDVQKLRAIFTWIAERITWEDDFEGQPDPRRVLQTKRGCTQEIAILVRDMCSAVGMHAEVVRGYLKAPGEFPDADSIARGNHWWNAIIIDGEWRIMDTALASPSHPRRSDFSGASSQVAESWYFLARPMEICYTHIPLLPEQQHIIPAVQHEVLTALPCACPTYFRHGLELSGFDTSMCHLEGLEMTHLHIFVPEDVECVAETEARTLARDHDGDLFESGDVIKKRALSQAEWISGRKRFTIKALLPPDTTTSTLKVYAGKRGLMHSVKDNPHSLAFALPLTHSGQNPAYDFFTRHPTPHAQRHDLYVAQPQCSKLVMNNTFVFTIRQHPSALSRFTPDTWGTGAASSTGIRPASPNVPYARPGSAMSMMSTSTTMMQSVSGSQISESSAGNSMSSTQMKPAKLAIQTPGQKIIRLTRKMDGRGEAVSLTDDTSLTSAWETIIKVSERGTWRGLVLADRSARWCVFAEWECV